MQFMFKTNLHDKEFKLDWYKNNKLHIFMLSVHIYVCTQQLHARAFLAFHFSFLHFSMSSFIFHIMGITLFSEKFGIEEGGKGR